MSMLRDVLFIASQDARHTLRARETIMWVFVMPVLFFYFIGTVTAGFSSNPSSEDPIAVRGEDGGFLVDQLERRLVDQGYTIVRPETVEVFEAYTRRITVPAAFTDSVLAGSPVTIAFANEREGLTNDYERIRVSRAVYSLLADLVVSEEAGQTLTPERLARLNEMPRALTLEVAPAGAREEIPTGYEQAIPGIMVMFILLVALTSGALLLVLERESGLLRRLAYTPISRLDVVLGKWTGKLMIGLVQVAFGMVVGTLIFKMNWGPNLFAVVLLLAVYAGLMASFGMLMGNLARTPGQAIGIGVLSANMLGALGGCWWPIEITPAWMQKLQLFLPTGWAMHGLHRLINFGSGPESVIPHIVVMVAVGVVVLIVSSRLFRFE